MATLAEFLNTQRWFPCKYQGNLVSRFGRARPVYSEGEQRNYGKAENQLYVSLSRDMALGYGCAEVPTECATADGTSWAVLRDDGKWYDVEFEELKQELHLDDFVPRID